MFLQVEEGTKVGIPPFGWSFLCTKRYHNFDHVIYQEMSSENT